MMRFAVVVAAALETGWVAKSVCDSSNTHTKAMALTHTDSRADGGYRKSAQQMCKERWQREERKEREGKQESHAAPGTCQIRDVPVAFSLLMCTHTHVYICMQICVCVLMCIVQFGLHELQQRQ